MDENFDREQVDGFSAVREVYDWVESTVTAFVAMILVLTFVGRIISVDGQSMENTLHEGDRLISYNLMYTPQNGDIVVVIFPDSTERPLVKRVIAVGGETIDINFDTGEVWVNEKLQHEPYIPEPTRLKYDLDFPLTVPEGHVFCMGDNRNHSWDSRDSGVGMIDTRNLLGKVIYRIMPFEKMGNPDKEA